MTPPTAHRRPNIVLIMTDDQAVQGTGCYGSVVNRTPAVDRIAAEGTVFANAFCTNAVCSPARASVLTGTYSHVNGMTSNVAEYDATQPSFPALLQAAGYRTAIVGKWHLGHGGVSDPHGFDHWEVLPHHGTYYDPVFLTPHGEERHPGYVTDIITERALGWLDARATGSPFCLLIQHKAPHRPFEPAERHRHLYEHEDLPLPPTLHEDTGRRGRASAGARMRMEHLKPQDLKMPVPAGLGEREEREWRYQRFAKEYLRVVAALDENVARVLHYLDLTGLAEDTLLLFTSDHGFFLGEHGWFDKRFMYEESLRIPLVARWPGVTPPGSRVPELVANIDLAPTLLDAAGIPAHPRMQGRSLLPLLRGEHPDDWRQEVYYRYHHHLDAAHGVEASYGIRTVTHKLIHYPGRGDGSTGASDEVREPYWELYDLEADPHEEHDRYHDPDRAHLVTDLAARLERARRLYGDTA